MSEAVHHVYLIPGFFGFSQLGDVTYFRAVRETLASAFAARGARAAIYAVNTFPTGSLRRRAQRLLETIVANGSHESADAIHLVGHSTGAVDARLLASTTRDLGFDRERALVEQKLRTLVSVAGPHHGTPLANFFTTLYGKRLLYVITLILIASLWRTPIAITGTLMGMGFRVYDLLGLQDSLLSQLTTQLLRGFTEERQREVKAFLDSILDDQSLMVQLTPEAMDVLNRSLQPLPSVRVVSYATIAPTPLQSLQRSLWKPVVSPVESALYATLYRITARPSRGVHYHPPVPIREAVTQTLLNLRIDASSNDGIVPSLSMPIGEFRGFVQGDHLDVVGHYLRGPLDRRDGADWLSSSAGFDRQRFAMLWNDVAEVIAAGRSPK